LYTVVIIGIGLIALYSASTGNTRVSQEIFFDQLFCAGAGLGIMYLISRIDYRKFFDIAYLFYGLNVLLLIMVLVSGRDALGARRWLTLAGISFQPSELTKLALVLVLGRYFAEGRSAFSFGFLNKTQRILRDLGLPLFITLIPMYLIFRQPDLGTALLMFGIFLGMLFASGTGYRLLTGFFILCASLLPFGWHFLKDYQKDRLLVFLNPNIDPLGAGYTIIQSKTAIGSGQLWGKGWLSGTQTQLNFLPERHTDFIFSVIGEEWGLAGTLILVYCYFALIRYCLLVAEQVKDKFGMLVCVGIVSILTLQVIINIGMVTGLCPIVGLTLPLVSYGRSSFLVFIIMLGFLLNLSKRRTIF
jgi:rod shape determining protein RodA